MSSIDDAKYQKEVYTRQECTIPTEKSKACGLFRIASSRWTITIKRSVKIAVLKA